MVRRKTKKNWKSYIPKRQKGTSITERPEYIKDREEFGHWEGDLVTGPRDGQNGAYLTLIERKTRFYYMIPISAKSSKQVYMQINKLHKFMVIALRISLNQSPLITVVSFLDGRI